MSMPIDFHVGKPVDLLRAGLHEIRKLNLRLDAQQQLAYDLYSASFFESSADARFVMLMMAVETLMTPQARPQPVLAHVEDLLARTDSADLDEQAKQSLLGSLRWLRLESLTAAGKRLVTTLLSNRRYANESADTFFKRSYELRHKLVHGSVPRPSRDEIDARAAELERLVGDLLAAPVVLPRNVSEPGSTDTVEDRQGV